MAPGHYLIRNISADRSNRGSVYVEPTIANHHVRLGKTLTLTAAVYLKFLQKIRVLVLQKVITVTPLLGVEAPLPSAALDIVDVVIPEETLSLEETPEVLEAKCDLPAAEIVIPLIEEAPAPLLQAQAEEMVRLSQPETQNPLAFPPAVDETPITTPEPPPKKNKGGRPKKVRE